MTNVVPMRAVDDWEHTANRRELHALGGDDELVQRLLDLLAAITEGETIDGDEDR